MISCYKWDQTVQISTKNTLIVRIGIQRFVLSLSLSLSLFFSLSLSLPHPISFISACLSHSPLLRTLSPSLFTCLSICLPVYLPLLVPSLSFRSLFVWLKLFFSSVYLLLPLCTINLCLSPKFLSVSFYSLFRVFLSLLLSLSFSLSLTFSPSLSLFLSLCRSSYLFRSLPHDHTF